MHANPLQRNMNHIHFEGQSNFSGHHDNVLGVIAQLGAFLIKLLNLAQYIFINLLIISYYQRRTPNHPIQDFFDTHKETV